MVWSTYGQAGAECREELDLLYKVALADESEVARVWKRHAWEKRFSYAVLKGTAAQFRYRLQKLKKDAATVDELNFEDD